MDKVLGSDVDVAALFAAPVAWALTALATRVFRGNAARLATLRPMLPMIAMAIAVFFVGAWHAIEAALTQTQAPFSWAVLWQGVAAGASAVWLHSQTREITKMNKAASGGGGGSPVLLLMGALLLCCTSCGAGGQIAVADLPGGASVQASKGADGCARIGIIAPVPVEALQQTIGADLPLPGGMVWTVRFEGVAQECAQTILQQQQQD